MRENDYVGDIEIQMGHDSEREQLVVRVIQAKNLPAKDTNGYSDPFVKIYLLPGREYVWIGSERIKACVDWSSQLYLESYRVKQK